MGGTTLAKHRAPEAAVPVTPVTPGAPEAPGALHTPPSSAGPNAGLIYISGIRGVHSRLCLLITGEVLKHPANWALSLETPALYGLRGAGFEISPI